MMGRMIDNRTTDDRRFGRQGPGKRRASTALRLTAVLTGLAMTGGLAGCSGVQNALGMSKNPPDEFAVVSKAPLVVPPDFALRPPQPGTPRPQELQPRDAARAAIIPGSDANSAKSRGEVALLTAANTATAEPNIRQIMTAEISGRIATNKSFADQLIFWQNDETTVTVVNAAAERERIRRAQAAGETVTGENTPTIRKGGGLF
jgi:hypothetical protein